MSDKVLETTRMVMNTNQNGGESLEFLADLYDNGDDVDNIFAIGTVALQSYGRGAAINLGPVSPEMFRAFADHLEADMAKHTKTGEPETA